MDLVMNSAGTAFGIIWAAAFIHGFREISRQDATARPWHYVVVAVTLSIAGLLIVAGLAALAG